MVKRKVRREQRLAGRVPVRVHYRKGQMARNERCLWSGVEALVCSVLGVLVVCLGLYLFYD